VDISQPNAAISYSLSPAENILASTVETMMVVLIQRFFNRAFPSRFAREF
jgi:hypothetical protein